MGILIYHVEINSLSLQEKAGFAYNLIWYTTALEKITMRFTLYTVRNLVPEATVAAFKYGQKKK